MTAQLRLAFPVHGTIDPAAGEAAKHRGIAQADANTDIAWADACDNAIRLMAARGTIFQAADLIREGLVDEPEHPNQWGARFVAAARAGIIRSAGITRSKRTTVKSSLCQQWIGTRAIREGRAA